MDIKLNSNYAKSVRNAAGANSNREAYYRRIHYRRRRNIRLVTVAVLLICLFSVGYKLIRLHEVNQQIATINSGVVKAKATNQTLQKQVDLLHDDNYLQELIRDKYMYTKKGEVVYNLPNSDPNSDK
ncbi:septum formation initiator family protein [Periweissella cryptocerci]|uniref:Septum formation initiator family protein n=1 Tax=Periweissella cryptocerci TaxID=2506420 RepID=A0A4P6YT72_9LACO|nr:septum formation initiator family protein [Periweissella cryptocerci]QBO35870.1 septum formation initiator family protein [Periweissella cryptocerci]